MGTAFKPAKTSPASWNAFSDVDAFVDAVLAESGHGGRWHPAAPLRAEADANETVKGMGE